MTFQNKQQDEFQKRNENLELNELQMIHSEDSKDELQVNRGDTFLVF